MSAGTCRFCGCTPESPCRIRGGDNCVWMDDTRTVCTGEKCQIRYYAEMRRLEAEALHRTKKRTPARIHELKMEEKRKKQRAYRARKRDEQKRGAA
jgi:hypothetical protein